MYSDTTISYVCVPNPLQIYLGVLAFVFSVLEMRSYISFLLGISDPRDHTRENKQYDLPPLSWEEIQKRVAGGCHWIIVDGFACDVRTWRKSHPGGRQLLQNLRGCDATLPFFGWKHPLYRCLDKSLRSKSKLADEYLSKRKPHSKQAYFRMLDTAKYIVDHHILQKTAQSEKDHGLLNNYGSISFRISKRATKKQSPYQSALDDAHALAQAYNAPGRYTR